MKEMKGNDGRIIKAEYAASFSFHPLLSVLYDFFPVVVHRCVHIYRLFRSVARHKFSNQLSAFLIECMSNMLKEDTMKTEITFTETRENSSFKSVQKQNLS